jgi:hypothetical protein
MLVGMREQGLLKNSIQHSLAGRKVIGIHSYFSSTSYDSGRGAAMRFLKLALRYVLVGIFLEIVSLLYVLLEHWAGWPRLSVLNIVTLYLFMTVAIVGSNKIIDKK